MRTFRLALALVLLVNLTSRAQVTVVLHADSAKLLHADSAKQGISPAQLAANYMPMNKLMEGMTSEQRSALNKVKAEFDRNRFASIEKQGPLPAYGFSYQVAEYVGANGKIDWVIIKPIGIIPDKLVREVMARLTVFYTETPLPITVPRPFQTVFYTSYGRPMLSEVRRVRTGDSTVSTLEAARATTRPDTVKYLHVNQLLLTSVPEVVYRFPNLEELDLSKNQLTHLPARLTAEMPSLRRLSVLFNLIGDDSVFVAKNTPLRALTLQGNKLTRIPASVANARQLESLWVGNNQLTELNVKPLRRLKRLNDLNLYNAGLTSLTQTDQEAETRNGG